LQLPYQIKGFDKTEEFQMRSTEEKVFEFFSDRDAIVNEDKSKTTSIKKLIEILSHSRLAKAYQQQIRAAIPYLS